MTGEELRGKLMYVGMEKAVRTLAVKEKLDAIENIAVMTSLEVCNLIADKYVIAYAENEEIGLVRKENYQEYRKLVELIER